MPANKARIGVAVAVEYVGAWVGGGGQRGYCTCGYQHNVGHHRLGRTLALGWLQLQAHTCTIHLGTRHLRQRTTRRRLAHTKRESNGIGAAALHTLVLSLNFKPCFCSER